MIKPFGLALALLLGFSVTGGAWATTSGAVGPARGGVAAEELPPQMRAALVRGLQEELNQRGYQAGTVDGLMGPRTRDAIRGYQRDAGLPVDGRATKELLDHIKFARPQVSRADRPVPPGERGAATDRDLVVSVQRELQDRGYYDDELDGLIGPNTRQAVRDFQRDAGLPVTGEVDQRLLSEIRAIDVRPRGETET